MRRVKLEAFNIGNTVFNGKSYKLMKFIDRGNDSVLNVYVKYPNTYLQTHASRWYFKKDKLCKILKKKFNFDLPRDFDCNLFDYRVVTCDSEYAKPNRFFIGIDPNDDIDGSLDYRMLLEYANIYLNTKRFCRYSSFENLQRENIVYAELFNHSKKYIIIQSNSRIEHVEISIDLDAIENKKKALETIRKEMIAKHFENKKPVKETSRSLNIMSTKHLKPNKIKTKNNLTEDLKQFINKGKYGAYGQVEKVIRRITKMPRVKV